MMQFLRPIVGGMLLVLAGASIAPGQEWARKMFNDTNFEFGAIARGSKAQHRFKFKNIYEETVHVAGVRSSCGCTSPEVSKHEIKTWESSDIITTFNTNAFLGHHTATITVTFDRPFYAEVQLHVTGNVRSDVVMQPGLVELGTIDAGQSVDRKISLTYSGNRSDWKILDVRSANTNFEVEVEEMHRSPGNVTYELMVRMKPSAPVGFVRDQLLLVTNDPTGSQIAVDVEGRVVAEVSVSPASLSLGALEPGEKITKNIVVRSKRAFKVLDVACDECFSCKLPTESREVQLIPVTFTASDQPGKIVKRIKIKTDLGANVVPDVICQATILGGGAETETATGSGASTTAGFRGN